MNSPWMPASCRVEMGLLLGGQFFQQGAVCRLPGVRL